MAREIGPRTKDGLPLTHSGSGKLVPETPRHIENVVKIFDDLVAYAPFTREIASSASARVITDYFKRIEWVEKKEKEKAAPGPLQRLKNRLSTRRT